MSVKDKYFVKPIPRSRWIEWVLYKHYAKRVPPIIDNAYGLFDLNSELVGVVLYCPTVNMTLRDLWKGQFRLTELSRLVVNEGLEPNALSYFVSTSLSMLPKPLVVVSYADTSQGHHGYIYQATNWIYTGLSKKYMAPMVKGQGNVHQSSIEGIGSMAKLRQLFGDRLYLGERPRKHRYFYFLGKRSEIKQMRAMLPYPQEPYPKGENKRYDAGYTPTKQFELF